MKTVAAIARFVLGLVFVVFGLNRFLNFMPMGPVPALAGQFAGALIQSHYVGRADARDRERRVFADEQLRPACDDVRRSDHRQHSAVSHLHGASGPSDRSDCRRALGCERVPISSALVAALPATIRRRRASGVARVAAELHRAVSLTRNPHRESSVEQLRSCGEEISHERRTVDEISRCRGIQPRFA